jgi:hypothetical protein
VCFGATGEGTLKVSLQGGNAMLPSFLIRRYVARLLFCVTSYSC